MTTCQISSFVVNIFTLIFEVQYTLVFKDVVVKFRKQYFITILRHWCPSSSKRFLMKTFLLSSPRRIVLPDYLLNTAKFKLFMLKRFYFPCHVYFFLARLCSLFPCHVICIVFVFFRWTGLILGFLHPTCIRYKLYTFYYT